MLTHNNTVITINSNAFILCKIIIGRENHFSLESGMALRYYIIGLQELPKINFLSMNHCPHDLNELIDQP